MSNTINEMDANPIISPDELPHYSDVQLQPVEASYKSILFIVWSLTYGCLLVGCIALVYFVDFFQEWQIILPLFSLVLMAMTITYLSIVIGFKNRSWAVREKDIIYRTGWLFQSTHIIPFVKVQHCIVRTGPIERFYGLASIQLLTAASHVGDISIHGLKKENAEQLKEWIMEKIAAYASPGV
jgi:hypothetical protein